MSAVATKILCHTMQYGAFKGKYDEGCKIFSQMLAENRMPGRIGIPADGRFPTTTRGGGGVGCASPGGIGIKFIWRSRGIRLCGGET